MLVCMADELLDEPCGGVDVGEGLELLLMVVGLRRRTSGHESGE